MATEYILSILGGKTNEDLSRQQDDRLDKLNISTFIDEKKPGEYQIKSISYEKRLYSPCCVNVELLAVNPQRKLSEIKDDFADMWVTLTVKGDSGATEIATDYFIYHYNVVYADSKCSVFLTLFSRDKLLTLDKFNKVYLNKQLGKGIIKEMLDDTNGLLKDCKVEFDVNANKDFDSQRLQFLSYSIITDKGKPTEKTTWYEVIQPYRVQYNEDFYSFISRIACRCGEFLYFENGKLKLGLDTGGTTINISGAILSKEYPSFRDSSLTVTSCFRNYLNGNTDNNSYSTASLPCSDYGAFDEYFDVFDQGVLPDKFGDEFWAPDIVELGFSSLLPAVGAAIGKQLYTSSAKFSGFAVELATQMGEYKVNADYINRDFKKSVFENKASNTVGFKSDQQVDGNKLSQFADVKPENYGKLMNKQFAQIRKMEQQAACNKIKVRVKTSFAAEKSIKLGSLVSMDGVTYIVTSCVGRYSQEQQNTTWVTQEDITEYEIVAKQAIPSTKKSVYVPPYDKCAESVPASPQIAVVTADKDPRYIGRVRVRYTWQNSNEPGSPWVRVLTPLASSSGAVHFQPKKDDEVLLGYIDGNIDRPYVAGSLFNDKDKIHDCLYSQYNDTIRVGSQRLDFRSGTMAPWFASFVPFAGAVTPFIPGAASALTKLIDDSSGAAKDFHGITRLTDNYGFWKIEGNTAARSVTIKSTYGKVTIDAYTGIKIESAGNISIKGNNVSISAQNNVTIESGVAIKNARKSQKIYDDNRTYLGMIVDGLKDTLVDLMNGKIDLSLFRTAKESILPSKEGTLKIKSNRYLLLEAGLGEAYDNSKIGESKHKAFAKPQPINDNFESYKNTLKKIIAAAESCADVTYLIKLDYTENLKKVTKAATEFNRDHIPGVSYRNDEIINKVKNAGYQPPEIDDYKKAQSYIDDNDDIIDDMDIAVRNVHIANAAETYTNALDSFCGTARMYFEFKDNIDCKLDDSLKKYSDKIVKMCQDSLKKSFTEAGLKNKVVHTLIGEYINDTDFFKIKVDLDNWDKTVESLKEKKENLIEKFWNSYSESLSSDSDYDISAFSDENAVNLVQGKILMSQNKEKSIEYKDKGFEAVNNVEEGHITIENAISQIKELIKVSYAENIAGVWDIEIPEEEDEEWLDNY